MKLGSLLPSSFTTLKCLLAIPGVEVDKAGYRGFTPLMVVAANNRRDMVELLLENGAQSKKIARAIAQRKGYTEIVKLFDSWDLFQIVQDGNFQILEQFLTDNSGLDERFIKYDHHELERRQRYFGEMRPLFEHSSAVDVNKIITDNSQQMLLFLAAELGLVSRVRQLLADGANPNLKNKKNKTARDLAQEQGYDEMMELFDNQSSEELLAIL